MNKKIKINLTFTRESGKTTQEIIYYEISDSRILDFIQDEFDTSINTYIFGPKQNCIFDIHYFTLQVDIHEAIYDILDNYIEQEYLEEYDDDDEDNDDYITRYEFDWDWA